MHDVLPSNNYEVIGVLASILVGHTPWLVTAYDIADHCIECNRPTHDKIIVIVRAQNLS